MTTAYRTSSVSGRIRTLALAGLLALGTMFPIATIVWADAGDPVVVEPTADPADAFDIAGEGLSGRTAVVAGGGDGADLRAEPAQDADVVSILPDRTEVALRIDATDTVYDPDGVTRWWPVSVGGSDGWVSGFFLAASPADASSGNDGAAEPTTEPAPAETTPPAAEGPVDTGTQFEFAGEVTGDASAQVAGAGESVNVRAEPASDSELVTIVADGQIVMLRIAAVDTVIDADGVTRWWPVTVDGAEGWISGFFLTNVTAAPTVAQAPEEAVPATDEPVSSDATTLQFPVGSAATVGSGDGFSVTLRSAGSPAADVVGNLSDGQTVQVVDGPVSFESSAAGWFEVSVDDLSGFVDGDLLSAAPEQVPATPADGEPEETAVATTDPAEAEPTADPAETPAATDTATEAATTEPADDETPVSTATAIPTTVATTEPDAGDDDDQDGPIPADTSDPETTPETDPEGEEAAGSTGFIYPLEDYRRTQGFGCSSLGFYPFDPDFGCAVHDGLDLAAPSGTPLLAAADGEVIAAGWCDCGLGYYVEIDHGEGVNTVYGHMESQPFVSTGQQVSQGDVIGPLGSTGISTGPHVHFMVRVNGVAQDPENYLP